MVICAELVISDFKIAFILTDVVLPYYFSIILHIHNNTHTRTHARTLLYESILSYINSLCFVSTMDNA